MAVEITDNQAVLRWYVHHLQGEIFVLRAVQVEDGDDRAVHCDDDSVDLGLLICVHFKVFGCNAVLDEYQYSFVSSFPIHPEGLVSSDGKPVVGIQVCLLDTDHVNVFCMQFLCEWDLLVVDTLCIPLKNVEWSWSFFRSAVLRPVAFPLRLRSLAAPRNGTG